MNDIDADTSRASHRAQLSLTGLSVGDAFGERFFTHPHLAVKLIEQRAVPAPPWGYTDDTEMAIAVVEALVRDGEIDANGLGRVFGERYLRDPMRGYGRAMHDLLPHLARGVPAVMAAADLFDGSGSYGNGAAMRVAPVGAYLGAAALDRVIEQARRSALPTHAHAEGQAGAVAVALAAALATDPGFDLGGELLARVAERTAAGLVRDGIEQARGLDAGTTVEQAATALGSGRDITAQDTVPFCLWCVERWAGGQLGCHRDSFADAMWLTVAGLGDRDTTCAIVGGIAALRTGVEGIPTEWLAAREPLPDGLGAV